MGIHFPVLSALIQIQLNTPFYIVKSQKNSFPKLYGGLMNIIKRTYNFQTRSMTPFQCNANAKFNSKQTSSIGNLLQKKYLYTSKNIVTKPNLDEFLRKLFEQYRIENCGKQY